MVLTSLKGERRRRPCGWAALRFGAPFGGRATRMASLASRSSTCLPPEGWICTVGAYCEDCEVCGAVTALDGVAERCKPGVTSPKAAEGSPHPASPLHLYTARTLSRTSYVATIWCGRKVASIAPKICHSIYVKL